MFKRDKNIVLVKSLHGLVLGFTGLNFNRVFERGSLQLGDLIGHRG